MLLNEIALNKIKTHLEYHETLNPKLWDSTMHLHDDVQEALENIANSFLETLKATKDQIEDIIITGSNANYNWSRLSDIDLHIILDYDKVCKCDGNDFDLDDCMKAKKTVWNNSHEVTIKGFNVEVYAQPITEPTSGNSGKYSLVTKEWIREPTKEADLVYDESDIKKKAKKLMDQIDEVISGDNANASNIKALQDKIKKIRKAAIAQGGEFSLENLVYKTIRNNGYMDKLYDMADKIEDNDLSLS